MNLKGYSKILVGLVFALLCLTLSGCKSKEPEPEVLIPVTNGTMTAQETLDFAATGQANQTLEGTPVGQGALNSSPSNCTYTPNYWNNNPERWLTVNFILGRFTYTKEQALALYASADSDERSAILREFIAAALNILKGADPSTIETVLSEASSWIDNHPVGIQISSADMQTGKELAAKLQAYNNGQIGPGLCPDEPATPTPTQTATPTMTPTSTVPPVEEMTPTPYIYPTKPRTNPVGPAIAPTQKPVEQPTQAPTKQPEQPTQAPPTEPPPPPPTDVPPTPAPPPPTDAPPPAEQPTSPAPAEQPVPSTP